jgi:hypothetical protein
MKHLFFIILSILLWTNVNAQLDTVHLHSGKKIPGIIQFSYKNYIEMMIEYREIIQFKKDSINYISVYTGEYIYNSLIKNGYQLVKDNSLVYFKNQSAEKQAEYLRQAGRMLKTSGTLTYLGVGFGAAGLGLTTYGGIEGNKDFIYAGLAFSGLAVLFEIISPGFKIKAGNFILRAGGGM